MGRICKLYTNSSPHQELIFFPSGLQGNDVFEDPLYRILYLGNKYTISLSSIVLSTLQLLPGHIYHGTDFPSYSFFFFLLNFPVYIFSVSFSTSCFLDLPLALNCTIQGLLEPFSVMKLLYSSVSLLFSQ